MRVSHILPALLLTTATSLGFSQSSTLETITIELTDISQEYMFDGLVEAVNEATLSAQTTGRVAEVFFDVDDFVNQGEVVVRLRDNKQKSNLKQAEAKLREAKVRFNYADKEFRRISAIYERQLVSKAQHDSSMAELEASRAYLSAVRAEQEKAKEELERTLIRAPYAGIVVERFVEVGEMASLGTPIMRGIGLNKLRININIPQRLINLVRNSKQALVVIDGSDGETRIPAENLTFFPYADEQTRTFRVRVELPEQENGENSGLFPGMFVKVVFAVSGSEGVLVPVTSVVQRSEVRGVYVLDEWGKVHFRYVRPGKLVGDGRQVILAGLQPGDKVALEPLKAVAVLKAGTSSND